VKTKKTKIPDGYESMDMEWVIDPHRSAVHLAQQVPVGWRFFQLNRKDTKAVVTYIRPKEQA
jgi:hypothetical protein